MQGWRAARSPRAYRHSFVRRPLVNQSGRLPLRLRLGNPRDAGHNANVADERAAVMALEQYRSPVLMPVTKRTSVLLAFVLHRSTSFKAATGDQCTGLLSRHGVDLAVRRVPLVPLRQRLVRRSHNSSRAPRNRMPQGPPRAPDHRPHRPHPRYYHRPRPVPQAAEESVAGRRLLHRRAPKIIWIAMLLHRRAPSFVSPAHAAANSLRKPAAAKGPVPFWDRTLPHPIGRTSGLASAS